jgi:hypothetical protein
LTLQSRWLSLDYEMATGHWVLTTREEKPVLRLTAGSLVKLTRPLGETYQRDLEGASVTSAKTGRRRGQRTDTELTILRQWPDGLRVEQRFAVDLHAPVISASLSIFPPRGFPDALRALSPVTPPVPGQPNLRIDPWGSLRGLIDFGWTSTEPARWLPLADDNHETRIVATGLAAIGCADHPLSLALGFLDSRETVGEYELTRGSVSATTKTFTAELAAHASFEGIDVPEAGASTGWLWLSLERLDLALPDFARRARPDQTRLGSPTLGSRCAAIALGETEPGTTRLDEASILTTLASVTSESATQSLFDAAFVPLGWEAHQGDGVPDPSRFPEGALHLRNTIEQRLLRAGLALAPFEAEQSSDIITKHPTWLKRTSAGDPLPSGSGCADTFVLDSSNPAVTEWLGELGARVGESWRFDVAYLKHLSAALETDWQAQRELTSLAALRRGVNAIAAGLGPTTIVATGGPLSALRDLVDVIETDAGPLLRAQPSPLLRSFLGGGRPATCAGPLHLHAARQTLDEGRAAATIAAFGGSFVLVTDPATLLSPEPREIISACLPPLGWQVLPFDPFAPGGPRVFGAWIDSSDHRWLLVTALNPRETEAAVVTGFDALGLTGPHHAFEFWSQSYLGILDERLSLQSVPPGGCQVVALRPARDYPQLVGTSLHVGIGAVEIQEEEFDPVNGRLRLLLALRGERQGTLTISTPRQWTVRSIRGTGGDIAVHPLSERLAQISTRFRDVAELELQFWHEA